MACSDALHLFGAGTDPVFAFAEHLTECLADAAVHRGVQRCDFPHPFRADSPLGADFDGGI